MNAAHRIDSIDYSHDIRPYLQLPHLLSLTWLAYPILSLIFIVFRLQISSDSANDAVANVKADLLASCKAAEHAATSTASMPRYLAIATNQQITDAVNGTLNAARATMTLALTVLLGPPRTREANVSERNLYLTPFLRYFGSLERKVKRYRR